MTELSVIRDIRIGVLSTLDAPLLGYLVRDLLQAQVDIQALILEAGQAPRDHVIHEERTGGRMPPIPLETFEMAHIPLYMVTDHRAPTTVELVRTLGLDLLINGGTPRVLTPDLLTMADVVNCHPGLLPSFRGCTCVEWAIYLDEPVGNTVHFMNERIDEGPIVLQEAVPLLTTDTYQDVRIKVYEHGHRLMAKAVTQIVEAGTTRAMLIPQGAGRYFKVIDDDKMRAVYAKLAAGAYRYAASPTR